MPRPLERAMVGLVYASLTCLVTWPLVTRVQDSLPLGRTEPAAMVALFNLWTLRWNADRALHLYDGYWDAPIFYPEKGVLALSEPHILSGLGFALPYVATGNGPLAYNLLLLGILAWNALAAQLLLRELGVARLPAFLGGLLALDLSFLADQLGVLQLTVLFPVFHALRALRRVQRRPTPGAIGLLGLWSTVTVYFCVQYGVYWSLFLVLGAICLAERRHANLRTLRNLAAGLVLAIVALVPLISPLLRTARNYSRDPARLVHMSAEPVDYLKLHPAALGDHVAFWLRHDAGTPHAFYPGTGLLVLGALGLAAGLRGRERRFALYCASGAALAFLFSLGPRLELGGFQPYEFLRAWYPGMAELRSPHRFAAFAQIFLVALAGLGAGALWARPGRGGRLLAVGLVAWSFVEVLTLPARLYPIPESVRSAPWVEALREQPRGPVAMLPIAEMRSASEFQRTVLEMLQGLDHGMPLVNGYSGFLPRSADVWLAKLRDFPSAESARYAQEQGVRYLVVDRKWLGEAGRARIEELGGALRLVFQGTAKSIFEVVPLATPLYMAPQ